MWKLFMAAIFYPFLFKEIICLLYKPIPYYKSYTNWAKCIDIPFIRKCIKQVEVTSEPMKRLIYYLFTYTYSLLSINGIWYRMIKYSSLGCLMPLKMFINLVWIQFLFIMDRRKKDLKLFKGLLTLQLLTWLAPGLW